MTVTRYAALIMLVPLLSAAAWVGHAASDRTTPVTDVRLEVVGSEAVPQGANMQIKVSVFYRKSCHTIIARSLYDSHGQRYALADLVLPPGDIGLQFSVSTVALADTFPPGPARYVSHPTYECNRFQRLFWPITMPERVASFNVVEK
jgi:hypothetical protein